MTFHSWVDTWGEVTEAFQRTWIQQNVVDAELLGKPLVLQELGKIVEEDGPTEEERLEFFKIIYDEVEKRVEDGKGPLKGAMFWQW